MTLPEVRSPMTTPRCSSWTILGRSSAADAESLSTKTTSLKKGRAISSRVNFPFPQDVGVWLPHLGRTRQVSGRFRIPAERDRTRLGPRAQPRVHNGIAEHPVACELRHHTPEALHSNPQSSAARLPEA